ncbi:MAG: PAC2 family protein [Acidimicrobiia bacterium]|nr:PAC2 family protein [Acidimicrobiia bacterium]
MTGPDEPAAIGYEWLVDEPMLHEPVLIVMLSGWIDAGGAAAAAADAVVDGCEASPIVRFDDDTFIDYRARRPTMEVRDGVNSNLLWSTIELSAGRAPGGRDVIVLTGPEPDMAWRRFAKSITDIAVSLGVGKMAAFGAYPFAAPHTRDPRLSCTSPSTDVLASVTFTRSSVDVPAGIASLLEHTMHDSRIPALGIWAQVPHYLATMTYPAASVALLDGLEEYAGIEIEAAELRESITPQRSRIDAMIADNPEHVSMLAQLEELYDSAIDDPTAAADPTGADAALEMQSGDDLAAEIQRFLRDQD